MAMPMAIFSPLITPLPPVQSFPCFSSTFAKTSKPLNLQVHIKKPKKTDSTMKKFSVPPRSQLVEEKPKYDIVIFGNFGKSAKMAMNAKAIGLSCVCVGDFASEHIVDMLSKEGFMLIHLSDGLDIPEQLEKAIQSANVVYCSSSLVHEYPPNLVSLVINCAIHSYKPLMFNRIDCGGALSPVKKLVFNHMLNNSKILMVKPEFDDPLLNTIYSDPVVGGLMIMKYLGFPVLDWVILQEPGSAMLIEPKSIYTKSIYMAFSFEESNCPKQDSALDDAFACGIIFGWIHSLDGQFTVYLANAIKAAARMGENGVAGFVDVTEILGISHLSYGTPQDTLLRGDGFYRGEP